MYTSAPETERDLAKSTTPAIDLRSDTVTKPSPEMRRAMFEAEVGDDVYAEDPTINRLEKRAAEIFGREAALFVPSGTMGNQIAIKLHTTHGQEVICEERGHVFNYEMAMMAHFSGCLPRPFFAEGGILTWPEVKKRIAPKIYYRAQTGLICLENTNNMAGGSVYPTSVVEEICDGAHEAGIPVHLDGARIFNAAVALGVDASDIAACADTVTFCLSKGLSCPIGSIFCGSRESVEQARRWRKRLGGGMRQVGVLAGAGLVALDTMVDRLAEDHANARTLAEGLAELPGVRCDLSRVQTNLVYFDLEVMAATEFAKGCENRGLLTDWAGPKRMRFVTHYGVDAADVQSTLKICEDVLTA
jgi:threonine aldolase